MPPSDKTKEDEKKIKAASAALAPVLKKARFGESDEEAELDISGFVTESMAGKTDADGTAWEKLHVDRRMYKPDVCYRFGGVRGYLVAMETMQSDIAKSPKNPEGFFDVLVLRTTAPFPYASDDGKPGRGDVGEDVLIVVTDRLKRIMELGQDPDNVIELQIRPIEKIALKGPKKMWRYSVDVNPNKIARSKVGIEARIGLTEGDKRNAERLLQANISGGDLVSDKAAEKVAAA